MREGEHRVRARAAPGGGSGTAGGREYDVFPWGALKYQ